MAVQSSHGRRRHANHRPCSDPAARSPARDAAPALRRQTCPLDGRAPPGGWQSRSLSPRGEGDIGGVGDRLVDRRQRSEEHTSELQSLMRISYAVFCLNKKKIKIHDENTKITH